MELKQQKLERLKRENESMAEEEALDVEIKKQEEIKGSKTFWGRLKKKLKEK